MPNLSPRETQTLQCLANGLSFKETACQMQICLRTVHIYVSRACRKLNQTTTVSVVSTAMSLGLIAHIDDKTNGGDSAILTSVKY